MLRSLRIENLVLVREGELAPAGTDGDHGRDGRGEDDPRAGGRPAARREGRRRDDRRGAGEAYVEAELDLPEGFLEDEELAALAELAPEDEPGLVLARRVFADGRTRAYAWGRAVAREDLAAAAERLIAMSGQFEQRRLGRPRISWTSSTPSSAKSSSGAAVRRGSRGGSSARPASGTTS